MVKRIGYGAGRSHQRPSRASGTTFAAGLDRLITLVGQRRRIEAAERPLRTLVAAEMTARYRQGGQQQFRRPGGLISLVVPRPSWEIFDQDEFTGWLVANGYSWLVTDRVVVTDQAGMIALVRATGRSGRLSQRKLNACVSVRAEADADAPERLNGTVRDDGTLLTADGQTVPGVRALLREPWVQVCAAASSAPIDVAAGGSEE